MHYLGRHVLSVPQTERRTQKAVRIMQKEHLLLLLMFLSFLRARINVLTKDTFESKLIFFYESN